MAKVLIGTARFALSAWVGAAVLFVVVGIQEVRSSEFDSIHRDLLVGLRFPPYYAFGFALMSLAWLALTAGLFAPRQNRRRLLCFSALVLFVLALMAADYVWVYSPLVEMITPPGKSRPAEFVSYHNISKWLNFASISLTAAIAFALCCLDLRQPSDK
jgi:hypothetical protein